MHCSARNPIFLFQKVVFYPTPHPATFPFPFFLNTHTSFAYFHVTPPATSHTPHNSPMLLPLSFFFSATSAALATDAAVGFIGAAAILRRLGFAAR